MYVEYPRYSLFAVNTLVFTKVVCYCVSAVAYNSLKDIFAGICQCGYVVNDIWRYSVTYFVLCCLYVTNPELSYGFLWCTVSWDLNTDIIYYSDGYIMFKNCYIRKYIVFHPPDSGGGNRHWIVGYWDRLGLAPVFLFPTVLNVLRWFFAGSKEVIIPKDHFFPLYNKISRLSVTILAVEKV